MSAHNLPSQLDQAVLTREQVEFDAAHGANVYPKAPTVTITGGEAGTVSIGIASDADDAALSKSDANDRTGITGVQPPATSIRGESALVVEAVSSSDFAGVRFDATNNGPRFIWRFPPGLAKDHPLYIYALWTSAANAVGDRTITWTFRYELMKKATLNILGVQPLGTLDTPIAAQAPGGGAYWFEETDAGVMNANTIEADHKFMHFCMGMSAFDASFTESKWLWKVIIEYTRRWTPA